MRRQVFEVVTAQLKEQVPEVAHIDLWNQNVEYLEQESPFPTPAVFIEFAPIQWVRVQNPAYREEVVEADITLHLHVVTECRNPTYEGSPYREEGLRVFDLLDEIARALYQCNRYGFRRFERTASTTNHNHEELREDIDTYSIHMMGTL